MKLIITAISINKDVDVTMSLMKKDINYQVTKGYELKSHVIDGKGHIILTYQPITSCEYSYHLESIQVTDDPEELVSRLIESNNRLDRLGYNQKSMFLDGQGNFIITYIKKYDIRKSKSRINRSTR